MGHFMLVWPVRQCTAPTHSRASTCERSYHHDVDAQAHLGDERRIPRCAQFVREFDLIEPAELAPLQSHIDVIFAREDEDHHREEPKSEQRSVRALRRQCAVSASYPWTVPQDIGSKHTHTRQGAACDTKRTQLATIDRS